MDITGSFKDSRLQVILRKQKAKEALFEALIDRFEFGRDYSEKEVNEVLAAVYNDYAILRRYLVDTGRLGRDLYGQHYWRAEKKD
ncbi:transcriptional regulator [Lactobacillus delbrueckii subsp. bulgaricus]|nr:transcriptional regulator [Lactobacillus delbrueckii subsp. bulgaricus]